MEEVIEIENFLVVKKARVEIKKVNVIIGRQAQGKSIVAKLSYFFGDMSENFMDGIRELQTKKELDANILERFEGYFPRYTWEGTEFQICYYIGKIEVCLAGVKRSKNRTQLKLTYSQCLSNLYSSRKKLYKRKKEEIENEVENSAKYRLARNESMLFYDYVVDSIRDSEYHYFFTSAIFIPASRTFFANLQKNIFTFLASNIDIDPFIKEFGSLYDSAKKMYGANFLKRARSSKGSAVHDLDRAIETIVGGEYENSNDQDWIVSKYSRINLANASSGQQEATPMLLLLTVWPYIFRARGEVGTLYIEEPEAHLFPDSQSRLVSLFSILTGKPNCRFFITTHSPYILSALNNLILAYDAIKEGRLDEDEFIKVNGRCKPLSFESVSAYTMEKGQLRDIKDSDTRMVGGEVLDKVSEHFEEVVDYILSAGE